MSNFESLARGIKFAMHALGRPLTADASPPTARRPTCAAGAVPCREQGFFIRPPGPNRWPPVPVYRTGWTGYQLKPVKLKFEFKTRSYTGFEHLTDRLDRFTGPV